jgi:hypothetical protein
MRSSATAAIDAMALNGMTRPAVVAPGFAAVDVFMQRFLDVECRTPDARRLLL